MNSILQTTHPPHLHRIRLAARSVVVLAVPLTLLVLAFAVAAVAILLVH